MSGPVSLYVRSGYQGPERCDEWKMGSPDPTERARRGTLFAASAVPFERRPCQFAYQRRQTSGGLLLVCTRAPSASEIQVAWEASGPNVREVADWSFHQHTTPFPSRRGCRYRDQ